VKGKVDATYVDTKLQSICSNHQVARSGTNLLNQIAHLMLYPPLYDSTFDAKEAVFGIILEPSEFIVHPFHPNCAFYEGNAHAMDNCCAGQKA
jgi:hypothetical protein